jgi:hypothetical protein
MLPSELSNFLFYIERDKRHWRSSGSTEAFNQLPQAAQDVIRPFLTGPFPEPDVQLSLCQKVKAVVAAASPDKAAKTDSAKPEAKAKPGSKFKRAKRVPARSAETWRILKNYPEYEISTFGRLRNLNRAVHTDCLKPRFVWHHGKVVEAFVLWSGGAKYTRFKGPLMVSAGIIKAPKWMVNHS